MARRRRRSRQVQKAAPRPNMQPAATFTAQQVQALISNSTTNSGQVAQPLPRLEPQVPFGPGLPIFTGPIDPLREDTGRPEPRIYEYPVSINLPGMTDRLIPWKVLRDAAEIPVVRDCIRIRQNEVASLEWDIVVTKRALQAHRKTNPDTSSVEIQRRLREKLDPEVSRLVEFWETPDWQQGESFVDWCTKLLEEHLVLDALAIYPFWDRGHTRQGFRILDGATIKPMLDHLGGRPAPPNPAYQQILWGFPRGEYVVDNVGAELDENGRVLNGFNSDRLIYKRRQVRTITPYGFSAVEQAIQDVDLYLRRLEWDKAAYTDGVQPAGWIKNNGMEQWTPQQLLEYNRAFNDLYSGQTLERMRYHLLPPGMEPVEAADIPEKYKPDYHLHLIKLVSMHFDVTLAELGFTESKGLGSTGWHEGQENVQERKATNPTLRWLQAILTQISRTHLGMPVELEFKFLGLDAEDQAAADAVTSQQLKDGRITWNEAREEMGRPPYDIDEANMPSIQTARGLVFIEGASQLAPPGEEITPPQGPAGPAPVAGPAAGEDDGATQPQDGQVGQPRRGSGKPDQAAQAGGGAPDAGKDRGDASVTKAAAAGGVADRVVEQLADDYPPAALEWVKGAAWSGPEQVPLSKVDFSGADSWQASKEPEKVAKFAKKIKKGKLKPVVLVQRPGKTKLIIIDGHHRSLAYKSLGLPVTAWIGVVDDKIGPWDEMHTLQFHGHTAAGDRHEAADKTATAAEDQATRELTAYWRWRSNGRDKRRPFEFVHVTKTQAMLADIDLDTVVFKAGDPGPKGPAGRHWPAWEMDQQVAAYWAAELRDALSGAPTRAIASRWLEARKDAGDDRRRDAEHWLLAIGWSVSRLVWRVLNGLYVDAFYLGSKAAQALLAKEERVAWGAWKPGSTAETRLLIAADGLDPGLQHVLADARRIAQGIDATRAREIAKALGDAAGAPAGVGGQPAGAGQPEGAQPPGAAQPTAGGQGPGEGPPAGGQPPAEPQPAPTGRPTVDELDGEITKVLTDETTLDRITLTETSRAISDGALARYDLARLDGLTHLVWETDPDNPCPVCVENADAGPVPIGTAFPSGAYSPPQHPRCRCAIFPSRAGTH